jgi:hypothetical protein
MKQSAAVEQAAAAERAAYQRMAQARGTKGMGTARKAWRRELLALVQALDDEAVTKAAPTGQPAVLWSRVLKGRTHDGG